MTTIHLDYFGMPGSGSTVKEAKLDAGRKIESAFEGSYAPVLLNHRGTLLVISRNPKCAWGYRMFDLNELKPRTVADHCSCGFQSEEEALLAAVKHLADIKRQHGERDSDLFDLLRGREQADARREFSSRAEWADDYQDRYKLAIESGMPTGDAHDFAGRNPARRELWACTEVAP